MSYRSHANDTSPQLRMSPLTTRTSGARRPRLPRENLSNAVTRCPSADSRFAKRGPDEPAAPGDQVAAHPGHQLPEVDGGRLERVAVVLEPVQRADEPVRHHPAAGRVGLGDEPAERLQLGGQVHERLVAGEQPGHVRVKDLLRPLRGARTAAVEVNLDAVVLPPPGGQMRDLAPAPPCAHRNGPSAPQRALSGIPEAAQVDGRRDQVILGVTAVFPGETLMVKRRAEHVRGVRHQPPGQIGVAERGDVGPVPDDPFPLERLAGLGRVTGRS